MNEVLQQLYARKSVRAFEETEITPQEKQAILQAAFEAPSAGNQQLYTILDITDSDLKQALSETCDHQPFIAKAPMVLVFCADCQKWLDAFSACGCAPRRPGPGDLLLAAADACIAGAERRDGGAEPGHRLVLYRGYFGKLRTAPRPAAPSGIRCAGGHAGVRQAGVRPAFAAKAAPLRGRVSGA